MTSTGVYPALVASCHPSIIAIALLALVRCSNGSLDPNDLRVEPPDGATEAPESDAGAFPTPSPASAPSLTRGLEALDTSPPVAEEAIDLDDTYANQAVRRYLSGRGIEDAVNWGFSINTGRRSDESALIPVPSNWEFQGFGNFQYGFSSTTEQGTYRTAFEVPDEFANQRVLLTFEGSMTDTAVRVNGRSAGPAHQGAFYRFSYDITDLLEADAQNNLEVVVSKQSANVSVNRAERDADYWTFGGIFRPVYLEILPEQSLERVAIDARASGDLSVDVFLRDLTQDATVTVRVLDHDLRAVSEPISVSVAAGAERVRLSGSFSGIEPWSAEAPTRYRLAAELATESGVEHALRTNFGFRTVEVRPGDGVYVNDEKVLLRGLNRHCFWPESGRALSPRISLSDVQLLKNMNANAVRSSHYPADEHFLEAADRLGLYVLDELGGWQAAYDTGVGRQLLEEMLTFDVNHPSIIFWDNGNEGGWNTALDGDFAKWDPQARAVLHPQAVFSNINTDHYEAYTSVTNLLASGTLYLPTEFLHGLYDGGSGSGLEDYWTAIRESPRGVGGFLWALLDEGVLRADQGDQIDVVGNAAPDGVVGPYRQPEGSVDTIRQLWSPVQIWTRQLPADFAGALEVENQYDHTDLATVDFQWQLVNFEFSDLGGGHDVVAEGSARSEPIAARQSGMLQLELTPDLANADALLLGANDASGRLIGQWSWMLKTPSEVREQVVPTESLGSTTVVEGSDSFVVTASGSSFTFSKSTGELTRVTGNGAPFSFGNGPRLAAGTALLRSIEATPIDDDYEITANYDGDLQEVVWRVMANGWLRLSYVYSLSGSFDFFGVSFDYPQELVTGLQWLGKGPYRVWKNRLQGPRHDVWVREPNDAITGQVWDYPEFKGYFADLYWARLSTTEGPIVVASDTPSLFLRVYTPRQAAAPAMAAQSFPEQDISILHGIAPIGDKFLPASQLGPQGQANTLDAQEYRATLYLRFGQPEQADAGL